MRTNIRKNAAKILVFGVILVLTFTLILHFVDGRQLIESIGVRNSYILLFFVALLGGVSSFTTGSYLASLYLFVDQGLSIWGLGLAGGLAIFIGDIIFFYLGKYGYQVFKEQDNGWVIKFGDWINRRRLLTLQIVTYLYVGITPLPNDILTLSIGASKYGLRQFIVPLFIGSIQLQILTAYLFSLGLFHGLAQ